MPEGDSNYPLLQLPMDDGVDERGYPLIFLQRSRSSLSLASVSECETVAYSDSSYVPTSSWLRSIVPAPRTQKFDDDGFPLLGSDDLQIDNPPKPAEANEIEEESLEPKPTRRRAAVLACAKTPTKRNKRKATSEASTKKKPKETKPMKKACAVVTKAATLATPTKEKTPKRQLPYSLDDVLFEPKLVRTAENNPRAELTAKVMSADGKPIRMHVCTTLLSSYGPEFYNIMAAIKDAILKGGQTKRTCQMLSDSLRAGSV